MVGDGSYAASGWFRWEKTGGGVGVPGGIGAGEKFDLLRYARAVNRLVGTLCLFRHNSSNQLP